MNLPDDPFEGAEMITAYTRQMALDDGMLVDVSDEARRHGFATPVALSAHCYGACVEHPRSAALQMDRLRCLLTAALNACADDPLNDRTTFRHAFDRFEGPKVTRETETLVVQIGPGDQGETVITVFFPEDD